MEINQKDHAKDFLLKYAKNLTELASQGKIDPVIGREDEIRRIIRILSRRTKNNPILIGDPGVGKTAIVEGMAFRIVKGNVPEKLKDKEIYELDMPALIAGAKFQGEFEQRLKTVLDVVKNSEGQIILFIDEVHMLVGTGKTQGAMDAANILKPSLARGEIKVIGATTLKEHREYIEKDSALERRMQKIMVAEPTVEDSISILRGIKDKYETFHGVRIHDNAIIQATKLSSRYITDRFLPDKAIDLIDEACASVKMGIDSMPDDLSKQYKLINQLKIEISALKKEKDSESKKRLKDIQIQIDNIEPEVNKLVAKWEREKKVVQNLKSSKKELEDLINKMEIATIEGDYDLAGKIKYDQLPKLKTKIENLKLKSNELKIIKEEVTQETIAQIVSQWTHIPVDSLLEVERTKLKKLESNIKKTIKGQDEAVSIVANAVKRSRIGISNPSKPIGTFLFLGPTGVGKTELAKQLAKEMFDSEESIIRIDMSEYNEKHSISKLIGSPPGYIGFEQGGFLTEAIRRKPYSIVLLDEIEKAHPMIFNLFLQIFDDGRVTDGLGKVVNFKNTIIIMTSNITSALETSKNYEELEIMEELLKVFKAEFINRVDEIISFKKLEKNQILEITKYKIDNFISRIKEEGYRITFHTSAINEVAVKGYDPQFGARPIDRYITKQIETLVANNIINGKILKNQRYQIQFSNNKFLIKEVRSS